MPPPPPAATAASRRRCLHCLDWQRSTGTWEHGGARLFEARLFEARLFEARLPADDAPMLECSSITYKAVSRVVV